MRTRTYRLLPPCPEARHRGTEGLRRGNEDPKDDSALQMRQGLEGSVHLGDH